MTNPNDPAYPTIESIYHGSGAVDTRTALEGLTKREEFAKAAPGEIPEWFVHMSLPNVVAPKGWIDYPEDFPFRQEMKEWQHDPCYDLPEELADFQKSWEDFGRACTARKKAENENRYFQWRTYYADRMIAELNKPIV